MKKKTYLALLIIIGSAFLISSCTKQVVSETTAEKSLTLSATELISNVQAVSTFTSNSKNLNSIMFIPTDNPALPNYKLRLSELFIHFQNWLHAEMLRNGDDKNLGLPKFVQRKSPELAAS